jgi:hypothetical protein
MAIEKVAYASSGRNNENEPFTVIVESIIGEVFVHVQDFENEEDANALRIRVEAKGEINLEHWAYCRTVYGSKAYIAHNLEQAQIERELEEDYNCEVDREIEVDCCDDNYDCYQATA